MSLARRWEVMTADGVGRGRFHQNFCAVARLRQVLHGPYPDTDLGVGLIDHRRERTCIFEAADDRNLLRLIGVDYFDVLDPTNLRADANPSRPFPAWA